MKEKIFKIYPLSITLVALILWFIGLLGVEGLKFFTFLYVALFFFGAYASSFLLRGIFLNNEDAILKRTMFILTGGFLVGFLISLVFVLPIEIENTLKVVVAAILVAVGVAAIISLLFRGSKKWDQGDNEKPGYKNYRERLAEEEKTKTVENNENE